MAKEQQKIYSNQSITKKEQVHKSSFISGSIFITLLLGITLLNIDAYMAEHPREDIAAQFTNGLTNMLSDIPRSLLYFLPINYLPTFTLLVVPIVILLSYVNYLIQKQRLHAKIDGIEGTADWQDLRVFNQNYADFDGKDCKNAFNNIILSQNARESLNTKKHFHALSTLILGATGTGKSRYFLKPNLLQMNSSYVVTDPKGEILQNCGEALRRFGYNVRVFDLLSRGNCDTYNPLKYCYREDDIKKLVQAFMKNTDPTGGKGGGNQDPFWDNAMNAFLCATIALLTSKPEGYDIPYGQIPEITGGNCFEPCFANLCELTRMANKKWEKSSGIELYEGVQLGDGKNNTANASELAAIFENLRMWEAERQDCTPDMMQKPYALREWENFRIAPEKTSTTILMTAAVRLDPFNIEEIKNLTSTDTLDLETFADKKEMLFIIISATDKTYNFLASFLYTQLFDILYNKGTNKTPGSKNLYLQNGDLVKHFTKEEVDAGIDEQVDAIKHHLAMEKIEVNGKVTGKDTVTKTKLLFFKKKEKVTVHLDDSYYDIKTPDGTLITRRPTKALAEKFIADCKQANLVNGRGVAMPMHVRFLMDEFANIGEVPEFKEKLATMRGYEISATVICQSITQLKGMYPDDYEVVDANCPQTVFLGGDENTNNEYLSKKMGASTVKNASTNVDNKKISGGYQTKQRNLMNADELGRMPFSDTIVLVYGEQPLYDKKFDYPAHKNYKYTNDYACDIGCNNNYSVFDRNVYRTGIAPMIIYKPIIPEAVPDVQELTADALIRLLRTSDVETAEKRLENNFENMIRNSLDVGETAAQAF